MEHGDYLSAWTARVAARLVVKMRDVLRSQQPYEQALRTLERCFDYILIEEGAKLIVHAKGEREHPAAEIYRKLRERLFVETNAGGGEGYFKSKYDQARAAGAEPKKQNAAGMVWLWKCPGDGAYNRPDVNYCPQCGRPSPAIERAQRLEAMVNAQRAGMVSADELWNYAEGNDLLERIIEGEFENL